MDYDDIIAFRHELHQHPELSGKEFATQKRISDFVAKFNPDELIKIAKTGLAVIYKGLKEGKTLLFRGDIDALPIAELNKAIDYTSLNLGVAHLCGHDGHTAVLLALAKILSKKRPESGRVVLLFQPAEETGQGAKAVLNDKNFKKIEPDYIFGFHNLPGFEKDSFFIKKGVFAAASCGLIVEFHGRTAHAAEPEKGINPAFAIARLTQFIRKSLNQKNLYNHLAFATIVHINLGDIAFGTSPENAVMMLTMRAFEDTDLHKMQELFYDELKTVCQSENIVYSVRETEQFPTLVNDSELFAQFLNLVKTNDFKIKFLMEPFRWSEDFAYFSQKYPAFYFGIGAGDIPNLHSVDYNFPDDIIDHLSGFLETIARNIN
ncbi:MAG: amidohydrolase [Bacteroidales bacterium]|nr:amidohydrolase [Bacteroidales bacterium]